MKKGALICCAAASIGFAGLPAMAKDGVAIALPDQRVAVLSEGDLEAASMGSYSVAVFKDAQLLHFDAGAVFSRNGTIFRDDDKLRVKSRTSPETAPRRWLSPSSPAARENT